ncbi:LOW QUALITY PROTEIN: vacuolar protein sorting-associated protein 54-like [Homalodisca vitripennis]|uniref:LOW QUALITY PROTEIN: vacuolar protein sorting-associated protein 54-like n=1 Tax=Homalodisca vitripennis TaxID=197043 RepID=UPI001EEBAD7F|nr:LOW QUALITY PROTEIN: vacuolar protein sorting-associated protein 54-like [Homalodisca vitripennis]
MEETNRENRSGIRQVWQSCAYCSNLSFTSLQQFIEHLRSKHCTQEGGSFVCRYGENNVCCTLPVEGVNDLDYERHVFKHHTTANNKAGSRKVSQSKSETGGERWTSHTTAQNLPAVLNDPRQGKQKDFFTKTWGDSFVEVTDIPAPHYLPHISLENFQAYLRKTAKRHRKHARLNSVALKPYSHAELLQTFPNLRVSSKSIEKNQFDISVIPKIFLDNNFALNNIETFNTVFPHLGQLKTLPASTTAPTSSHAAGSPTSIDSAKILQEKLTHYLDIVEVQIAQQVSQKSDAFFLAMTSHDTLMEQLGHTISMVRTLREKINSIDSVLVKDSLTIIKCERRRAHYLQVYNKLKLMSTVLQTQPTIQLLLSAPDYVAALDLIYTTQELLSHHLAGVHSFRHLGSELNEMVKVIGTLMTGEFERYATADLNRPLLESEDQVLQGDKLSCIVLGMLRRGCFDFIDAYQQETISAIKAAIKQAVIEVVATSDTAHRISGDSSLEDQLKALATEEWTQLLKNAATTLRRLVRRVKKAADIMQHATDASTGTVTTNTATEESSASNLPVTDYFLSAEDHAKVSHKLKQLLTSTCQYTQERCAQLLSSKSIIWPDEKCPTITDSKERDRDSHWLAEKATLTQLSELYQHVELLSRECEAVCPEAPASYLRSAFRSQANRFMQRFHFERMTKLSLILDSESWRQAEVPVEFQQLLDQISETGTLG